MLKKKILNKLGGLFEEWLLGFNPDTDFNVGLFTSEKINLRNAILNTNRVNEALYDQKASIRLRAGLIGKLSVKVSTIHSLILIFQYIQTSLLNLFSESVMIEVSNIHLIFGPNRDYLSSDEDFSNDLKGCFYDLDDQITNIVMMHELVDELMKPERRARSQKKQEEK